MRLSKRYCVYGLALSWSTLPVLLQNKRVEVFPAAAEFSSINETMTHFEAQKPAELYPYTNSTIVPANVCSPAAGREFLSHREIQNLVNDYARRAHRNVLNFDFIEVGRKIYQYARRYNKIVLTVQVGGMDGVTNDPMNSIFVQPRLKPKQVDLSNWLPIVAEPVSSNFEKLKENYKEFQKRRLKCAVLKQWAITYGGEATCEFCHFNLNSTHPKCVVQPEWKKHQVGSLDCAQQQKFFANEFDECFVKSHVSCGTLEALVKQSVPISDPNMRPPVGLLQIDVEGHEAILLSGFIRNTPSEDLPVVIHFEHKVIRRSGDQGSHLVELASLLRSKGYYLQNEGEDILALRVSTHTLNEDLVQ